MLRIRVFGGGCLGKEPAKILSLVSCNH